MGLRISHIEWFVAVCCATASVKKFVAGDTSAAAALLSLFVILTVHAIVTHRVNS